jgi:hypothetical protein
MSCNIITQNVTRKEWKIQSEQEWNEDEIKDKISDQWKWEERNWVNAHCQDLGKSHGTETKENR